MCGVCGVCGVRGVRGVRGVDARVVITVLCNETAPGRVVVTVGRQKITLPRPTTATIAVAVAATAVIVAHLCRVQNTGACSDSGRIANLSQNTSVPSCHIRTEYTVKLQFLPKLPAHYRALPTA